MEALKASGAGIGWVENELGHGPAYQFHDPDGHLLEIYYETEWYQAPPELRPSLKNQAQRFPARGVNVRRLDHFNCLAADVKANREFFEATLGFRLTEQIVLDNGIEAGDVADLHQQELRLRLHRARRTASTGRFHHVTYALDSREEVLRAADIFLENGVIIETGPHKHAVQQTFFLYVYEPGGNRVEVANAGARLMLAPDWKPIVWTEAERRKGQAWGLKTIESFHTHGTPPLPEESLKMSSRNRKTALVVSAHSADFVWRAGGAIALHAAAGEAVTVICLSYGERGESAKLWRQEGMTLERVKTRAPQGGRGGGREARRRRHSVLGPRRLSAQSHAGRAVPPRRRLPRDPSRLRALAFRDATSTITTTPPRPISRSTRASLRRRMATIPARRCSARRRCSCSSRISPSNAIGSPTCCSTSPPVWEKKRAAIECMAGQEHLWEYYTRVALQRGAQAARNSDKKITYGEGYQAVFPHVVERLA